MAKQQPINRPAKEPKQKRDSSAKAIKNREKNEAQRRRNIDLAREMGITLDPASRPSKQLRIARRAKEARDLGAEADSILARLS